MEWTKERPFVQPEDVTVSENDLRGGNGRPSGRSCWGIKALRLSIFWDQQDGNGPPVGLDDERSAVDHLAGRAEPRAENRAVRRGLMLRMVEGMRDRLGVHDPAHHNEAERKPKRD